MIEFLLSQISIEYREFFFQVQIGEVIGYISSFLLAICGSFEALRSIKNKRCDIGNLMLYTWLLGEIGLTVYNLIAQDLILFINYGFNILFILIMVYYKVFPKRD